MDSNIYTKYRRGFPRFRILDEPDLHIVVFPDKYFHLDPLDQNIIQFSEEDNVHQYSKEIYDIVSADDLTKLPIPRLAPLFSGLCRMYMESREATAAIAAEMLVDGMDLSKDWCRERLSGKALDFALGLVEGKASRVSDFQENKVTCFVANAQEGEQIRSIPGFV